MKLAKKILIPLLIVAGIGIMLMPAIFNMIDENQVDSTIKSYKVETIKDESETSDKIKAARKYNRELYKSRSTIVDTGFSESEGYEELLDFDDGMIGFVNIPAIQTVVPVFHDNAEYLARGAIHVKGSSLPVGGKNTHSVIAAHTGNSNGKFFTDLVELQEGDQFTVEVGNKVLHYVVDQIKTVLPDNTKYLQITEGKDYCTLLTCTPYGVNSHRLLVRGKRVFPEEKQIVEVSETVTENRSSKWRQEYEKSICISFIIFMVIMFALETIKLIVKLIKK